MRIVLSALRIVLSLLVALLAGRIGALPVLIFWPLIFPQPLAGETPGLTYGMICYAVFFLGFGIGGFVLTYKLLRRIVPKEQTTDSIIPH